MSSLVGLFLCITLHVQSPGGTPAQCLSCWLPQVNLGVNFELEPKTSIVVGTPPGNVFVPKPPSLF